MHGLYGVALIGARSGRVGGGGRYGRWGGRGAASCDGVGFCSAGASGRASVWRRTTERLTDEPTDETEASVSVDGRRVHKRCDELAAAVRHVATATGVGLGPTLQSDT